MKHVFRLIGAMVFMALLAGNGLTAESEEAGKETAEKKGPPPALVVVAPVNSGEVEAMLELIGTVYHARVSRVAAEVDGLVERVSIEAGQRVEPGTLLARLSTDILNTVIAGTKAEFAQVQIELEKVGKDLARIRPLFQEASVAESVYDEHYYNEKRLRERIHVIQADLQRLYLEKKKKSIVAPFAGVVVEKTVERGEWVSVGDTVAVVADDSEVDVVVDVPAEMLQYLTKDRMFAVQSSGHKLMGRFISYVPKGDVATRTFAVKLRLKNTVNLVEGMAARALLPLAAKNTGLLVPRDAIIDKYGRNVLFVVLAGKAKMVPVTVTGYSGMQVGVTGAGLAEGQQVVVKGNERLQDGQSVRVK